MLTSQQPLSSDIDDVVISIINFRTPQLSIDCVTSVLNDLDASPAVQAHVVVVDNASGDGSEAVLADWIAATAVSDRVTLICSTNNGGFSSGHNQALRARRARYYLLLNSDAVVRPGFFHALIETATFADNTGLVAPRLEHDNGELQTNCFRILSPVSELIRGAQTGIVTKALKSAEVSLPMPPSNTAIEWVSFACVLIRAEVIDDVGMLDEDYFLYFEDTEYCLRARRAGWKMEYLPHAIAVHFRGGSGPVKALAKKRQRLPKYYYASRTRFFYQAHGHIGLLLANLFWILGRGIALCRLLALRLPPKSVEGEAIDIWTNFWRPQGTHRKLDSPK